MNVLARATCIEALEKAFSTPLGSIFIAKLKPYAVDCKEVKDILEIKSKIIADEFSSFDEFIQYTKDVTSNFIQQFGANEEISIVAESILQDILENIEPYLQVTDSNWNEATENYIKLLKICIENVPNDKASFSTPPSMSSESYSGPGNMQLFERISEVNSDALIDKIQRIKNDMDIEYISDLLMNFEPQITHNAGFININLSQVNQYMLSLIDNYVKKCELRPPPPPPSLTPKPNLSPGFPTNSPGLSSLKLLPQSILQSFLMLSNNKIQRSNSDVHALNRPQTPPSTPPKSPNKTHAPAHPKTEIPRSQTPK